MQFTKRCQETIDACRFCWMCRHICPIGNATGQERNTSRARALSLSLVMRDAAKLEADIVDNVYECALCGGCTADCATGWDPILFTKEARLSAALEGNMPAYVEKMLENIENSGNIYGETEICDCLKNAIRDLPAKADVQLFIGKDGAYRTPAQAAKAVELLKAAGVSFTVDRHEPNSGYDMDFLLGAAEEARAAMAKTAEAINALGAKTVVCYDPADAKVFLREYKEYGIALNAEVVTFPAYLAKLIAEGALKVKKGSAVYTVQDSPLLSRDLEDSNSVRTVLSACGDLCEMLLNSKATMLAGNLIMNQYIPHVMKLVAENRWANAKHVGATTVVTSCPAEYAMLSATNDGSIELLSLEEAVAKCL